MRKLGKILIMISILFIVYGCRDQIYSLVANMIVTKMTVSLDQKNSYYLDYKFETIKDVDEFDINNKEDLINLYYSVLNRGVSEFSFYCPKKYEGCIDDVINLTSDQTLLSGINGYVHPFNSFDTIETTYDSLNRVNMKIVKTYTDVEMENINKKIEEVKKDVVKDEKDIKTIIKLIHDYIINNSKYDKERADNNVITYASNTAYGVLFEGHGICSGYADAMALFLDDYHVPNFKVSSEDHVWNAVYIDGNWYHLDLTWDDPITSSGEDIVLYDFFLIDSKTLEELDKTEHVFDTNFYKEFVTKK